MRIEDYRKDLIFKYIKRNEEALKQNQWELIYPKNRKSAPPIGFTETMWDADIDPLNYINYIPRYYLYKSNIKEFEIPYGIEEIKWGAFQESKLNSIKIPETVKIIEDFAFQIGDGGPQNITFLGTKEQWKNIKFLGSTIFGWEETTIHCSDGDIEFDPYNH